MNDDEQLHRRFQAMGFAGEPPMASTATDDLTRGRRHLRRRRAAVMGGGVLGVTALAVGVAFALPSGGPSGSEDLPVAGAGATTESPVEPTTTTPPDSASTPAEPPAAGNEAFWDTRQLLLATAVEHLDPAHEHLVDEATGFTGGGGDGAVKVGTKLGWTNTGEEGEAMVRVGVTTAGYTEAEEHAVENFVVDFGCDLPENCTEQTLPGGETVLVAPANPELNLLFAVSYERPDGSMVGVAVYDLFGNNSLTPVSEVDVTLEQAFAFVTDPDLQVVPDEVDDELDHGPLTLEQGEGTTEVPIETPTSGE
ncbi:hypothetical protein [Jiangella endophytica]|uniref:hypothetical protein n=1 Tax=Jiangella endophytica TaxID=1623398 RepID=UPI001300B26C|nr:hypothetical protein [Jiangella endophytica]